MRLRSYIGTIDRGRIGRVDFSIRFSLFLILISAILIATFIFGYRYHVISGSELTVDTSKVQGVLVAAIALLLIPVIVLKVYGLIGQRCHDFGWLNLLFVFFLPYGFLFIIVLFLIAGQKGPNKYGPPSDSSSTLRILGSIILPFIAVFMVLVLLDLMSKFK